MTDQRVINLLRATPNIAKIGKNSQERLCLSQMDIDKVFKSSQKGGEAIQEDSFIVGNTVKIKEGHFAGFNGKIISVDPKTQSLVLTVSVFSRNTEVRVTFSDVEKF
jgi:transcriptional antiterminator NusG